MLGNKKDLYKNRAIDTMRGFNKANKLGMNKYVEVSAKTKENLMETFKQFYMELYHKNKKNLLKRKIKILKCLKIYKNKKIIHAVNT